MTADEKQDIVDRLTDLMNEVRGAATNSRDAMSEVENTLSMIETGSLNADETDQPSRDVDYAATFLEDAAEGLQKVIKKLDDMTLDEQLRDWGYDWARDKYSDSDSVEDLEDNGQSAAMDMSVNAIGWSRECAADEIFEGVERYIEEIREAY